MPVFQVTQTQREVLEALEWLYNDSDESRRRTGRSWALALSYVRRMILWRPGLAANGLDVEDHVQLHNSSTIVLDYIQQIADTLQVDILCDRTRARVRLERMPIGAHYTAVVEALTTFDDRPEPDAWPLVSPQWMRGARAAARTRAARESGGMNPTPPTSPPPKLEPPRTLLDYLDNDSDGI